MHTHLLHIPHFPAILILLSHPTIPYSTETLRLGCILDIQIYSLSKDDDLSFIIIMQHLMPTKQQSDVSCKNQSIKL